MRSVRMFCQVPFVVCVVLTCTVGSFAGCTSPSESPGESDAADASKTSDTSAETTDGDISGDTGGVDAEVVHQFPKYTLEPGEEVEPCAQWTVGNDKPIYVNEVTLANGGGFHHSNWYVVPNDYVAGDDGFFDCEERGFGEFTAAMKGTVLFAQSTQAKSETQKFPEGSVVKIPPNHKIVADLHFLNIQTRKLKTFGRMTLGLLHPKEVDVVLTPFQLVYNDLDIPPKSEARFTGECEMASSYKNSADEPFGDLQLYYVLPHYHGLGNYFGLEILGGPRDGEQIYELNGFNAEANGQSFEPPVDLTGAEGFRFTCGYDNPRDESVGWGLGDQEMCVMLGYLDSKVLMSGRVESGNEVVERKNDIVYNEGPCATLTIPRADSQEMPGEEEKQGEMYVPEGDSDDVDPIPDCEDAPEDVDPIRSPTLSNLHRDIFSVSCSFSACHGAESARAGLNLQEREGLHDRLMNHDVQAATDKPLVEPGDPDASWLYRRLSECKPSTNDGTTSHMPRNSPTLLDPGVVAMVREWIAQGAEDN